MNRRSPAAPADYLEPEMPRAREELGALAGKEEDIISYAIFPQVTKEFLEVCKLQ